MDLNRIKWLPLSLLVLGTAGALVVSAAPWSSGRTTGAATAPPSASGPPAPPGPAVVPSFTTPAGYHVVYRVSAGGISSYDEVLWVDRPFDSVDETLSGPTTSANVDLATVSRLGGEVLTTGNSQPALIHVPAMAGAQDVRLDAVLKPALAQGFLRYEGTSTILGQKCWNYRSAQPLAATGGMARLRSSTPNYVVSCVGADGIVLAEATYKAGRLAQLRQAVSLSIGTAAAAGGDYGMAAVATPFAEGGGSFQALTLDSSPPGLSWSAKWIPPGFVHSGRYAVIPSQPQLFDQSGGAASPNPLGLPNGLVEELDDAYVSGPNLIVVQQGVTAGNSVFKAPTGGVSVALGPLMGQGQLALSATASFVSAEPDGGSHFVRVSGTVDPAVLVRVAMSLAQEAPGRLVQLPSG